jgi:hypothetical protein
MAGRQRRTRLDSPRQRFLAEGVVAMTGRLVGQAMDHAWGDVARTERARRRLLADLERAQQGGQHEASCVAALRSAVLESERVLSQLRRVGNG